MHDAINVPKGIQRHIPIIVGGNGRRKTAGLAVRFADELNYTFLHPDDVEWRMDEVRAMCESAGRDPATLRFSLYTHDGDMRPGPDRVGHLAALNAVAGLDRIVCFPVRWDPTLEGLAAFAEDCRAAGITLDG